MQDLVIGIVAKPQGIAGELKLKLLGDDPGRLNGLSWVFIKREKERQRYTVQSFRMQGEMGVIKLAGVENRDEAEAMRGCALLVERTQLQPLPKDTYYIVDLVGCKVMDENGREMGTVTDVLQPSANDVYVIQTPRGEAMIPVIRSVVKQVDVQAKSITVDATRFDEVAVYDED